MYVANFISPANDASLGIYFKAKNLNSARKHILNMPIGSIFIAFRHRCSKKIQTILFCQSRYN